MASIKELKKDINYLSDELIGNCFLHYSLVKKDKQKQIYKIMEEVIAIRDELIKKVNKPSLDFEKKSRKTYYRDIKEELIEKANAAFEKLDNIEKGVEPAKTDDKKKDKETAEAENNKNEEQHSKTEDSKKTKEPVEAKKTVKSETAEKTKDSAEADKSTKSKKTTKTATSTKTTKKPTTSKKTKKTEE